MQDRRPPDDYFRQSVSGVDTVEHARSPVGRVGDYLVASGRQRKNSDRTGVAMSFLLMSNAYSCVLSIFVAVMLVIPTATTAETPQWSTAAWQPAPADVVPSAYANVGTFSTTSLHIGGGLIQVVLLDGPTSVPRTAILHWISNAAEALSDYHQKFPVPNVTIMVLTNDLRGIHGGRTIGGRLIRITVGQQTTQADLDADWVMVHEMIHLSFPNLDKRLLWMEEGLATYLEPVMRARHGLMPTTTAWHDLVDGLPRGQPQDGDQGLDGTPTWGRIYWGGAGFWLMVDLHIREQTHNTKSIDDVLRGILAAGGDGAASWTIEQVIAEAQRATGTPVVGELYHSMALAPVPIDLSGTWQRLGVVVESGTLRFDDQAPQAAIRLAITAQNQTERHVK